MKPYILGSESLFPGVKTAGGRQDWKAAFGAAAPDFDPDQPKFQGALALRKWALDVPPAGDFTYTGLTLAGELKQYTLPGSILGKPNFAGIDNPYQTLEDWMAKQPFPEVRLALSPPGTVSISDNMKYCLLDQETQDLVVASLRNAGITVELLDDDGTYVYGAGYKPRMVFAIVNEVNSGIAIGAFWKMMCVKGVGAPGQWFVPPPGSIPSFVPDVRMSATVLAEWPVPVLVPAGYKAGMATSGIVSFPAFIPISSLPSDPAAGSGVGPVDLSPVLDAITQLGKDFHDQITKVAPWVKF